MKRLLFVLTLGFFTVGSIFGADWQELSKYNVGTKSLAPERRVDNPPSLQKSGDYNISTASSSAELPGEIVGETAYNYQTNDNLHDRLVWDPATNTLHAQWMYGDIAEVPNFMKRRMRYNYFDGSAWSHGLGIPIENERAGYGSLAVDKNNIAIPVSHHTLANEEACRAWFDFAPGFGFFQMAKVWASQEDGAKDLEPFWPDIAVDDADVWHVTTTNNNQDDWVTLVNGVNDNILYFRSTDRGLTWSTPFAMFPDTSKYPLSAGASGDNEAGSHQVEASDDGSGKVGVLVSSTGHDFYLFESQDRGLTFDDAIQVLGNPFPDVDDSLNYPIRWDIIVEFDSTTMAATDTSLYPFTGTSTDSGWDLEANIHASVHGPADLFYLNSEPHIVWSEMMHTAENSFYPNGYGRTWTTPYTKYLNGDSSHSEAGFSINHWSPSTGVSTIWRTDDNNDVSAGTFQQYVTMPQIGADASGNLYCLYTKYSDSDTLLPEDGISQNDETFGPLSFGKIWGAKSTDNGATWGEAVQLISDDDSWHQNMRYIAVANKNPDDEIHILFQNTSDVPGVPIGENTDHSTWVNADIRHWAVPVSAFPESNANKFGARLKLATSSIIGGVDFGNIGDAGQVTESITVMNTGDEDLVVADAFTGDEAFSVEPTSFTVAPGGSQEVSITFRPTVETLVSSFLAMENNSTNHHSVGIPLEGVGVPKDVSVKDNSVLPKEYSLSQNYPNPFNPSTSIQFNLIANGNVKLAVYNTVGKQVAVILNGNMNAGSHTVEWQPERLSSGVYFYRLTADSFTATKKLILMQ
jgi:hypothetical protein